MDRFEQFKSKFPEFSNLSNGEIVNLVSQYTGADPQRVYSEFGGEQNRSAVGDLGTALKIGVQRLPETVTGLGDVMVAPITGRASISDAADSLGRATGFRPGQWANDSQLNYSKAQQQFLRQGAQTEGFADTAAHYLTNPMRSVVQGVESVPGMALGGVYARGLRGLGSLGNAARFGAGEGGVMAGQAMNQMVDDGVDPARAAGYAAGVGALGGALGYGGGRLAERLGVVNPDELLGFGGRTALAEGATAPGLGRRVVGGMLSEGAFEEMPQSAMEAAMGNLAAERPWDQDVGKQAAAGLVLGGLMGGVVGVVPPARNPADPIDLLNRDTTPQASTAPAAGLNLTNLAVPQQGIFSEPSQVEQWAGIAPAPTAEQHASRAEDILAAFNTPVGEVGGRPVTAWEAFQREQGVPANRIQTGPAQIKEAAPKIDIPVPQPLQNDPVRSAVAQASPATLRKDGSLKDIVEKALGAYSEFSDGEIAAALEEFAASKRKDTVWRVAALEAIARQRAAQGAPNVAQVDAASGQGAGAVPAGSAGNTPSGPVVLDGVRQPAGAPAPSSAARVPVGDPVVQQPASVEDVINAVSPVEQVAPQAQEARGQESALAGVPLRPAHRNQDVVDAAANTRLTELPPEQKRVYDYLIKAVYENRVDDIVDAQGVMQFTKIGKALGKERGSIDAAVKAVMKKLAATQGMSVEELKTALRQRKTVAGGSDFELLGLSPAEQISVADGESVFGNDEGITPSMEIVDSVGKTNANPNAEKLGGTEEGDAILKAAGALTPRGMTNVANAPDPVAERRVAEAKARREAALDALMQRPEAAEAAVDWDDLRSDTGPTAAELSREDAVEWVLSYNEFKEGRLSEKELDTLQRSIERRYEANPPRATVGDAGAAGTRTGQPALAERSGTTGVDTGQQETDTREEVASTPTEPPFNLEFAPQGDPAPTLDLVVQEGFDSLDGLQLALDLAQREETVAAQAKLDFDTPRRYSANAEAHARDLGGTVVWEEGEFALVQGYSAMTGKPVYAGTKGGVRTNVDVETFSGSAIPADVQTKMVGVKRRVEAEAEAKHASAPFIKFDSDVVVAEGVAPGISGVAKQWKRMLGIDANVYITTTSQARVDKARFTGPHRVIGSATLDANEKGSMRRMPDGSYYVVVSDTASRAAVLETLAHELGHVHQREVFEKADPKTKAAIRAEHDKWAKSQQGATAQDLIQSLRARATGKTTRVPPTQLASELTSYWTSFSEWYADQVSRWATTSDRPVTVVERFFARLGAALRSFYGALTNAKYLPNETFKQYLDEIAKRASAGSEIDSRTLGVGDGNRFSRTSNTQGTTVEAVRSAINAIATPMGRRKVTVYQTADEAVQNGALNSKDAKGTQGWVDDKGNAFFIAGNIPNGSELAVVLHEIGAHLGIEKLLTDAQYEALVKKIFAWAQSDANTQEAKIARAALARVDAAKLENEADLAPETIAYFIEEAVKAGVNPTAMQYKTELGRWFRTLWAAFKVALRRLNLINADRLTAQNVVDLAYGAARIELASAYHGTAANFRRFDHRFMGSGEGAQAFGWGTYLAQRFGIANEYFEADVRRKDRGGEPYPTYDGERLPDPFAVDTANPSEIAKNALSLVHGGVMPNPRVYIDSLFVDDKVAAEALAVYQTLDPKKLGWVKEGAPEGNIHITDVNATEDELLDWGKPLSEQSEAVKAALARVGITPRGEWNPTGMNLYRTLQTDEDRLDDAGFEATDRGASEYLDSLGIKGIKFLDAKSRGQKRDIVDKTGAPVPTPTRPTPGVRSALTFVTGFDSMADALAEARKQAETYPSMSEMVDVLAYWVGKGYQLKAADQTRNLVIFNDANIYRVGSMRGGPVGKGGRMMFSKAADPQLVEIAQESGQRALKAIQAGIRKGWTGLAFSSHLTDAAVRAGLTSARALKLVQDKKQTAAYEIQIDVEKVLSKFASLEGKIGNDDAATVVQRFIYDSTFDQKWGFMPDWKEDATVDPGMESRFKAIERVNPQAAEVIKDVFRHGDAIFRKKQDLLRKTITGEYEALIKAETDDGKRRKLERQRDKELREAGKLLTALRGPYSPLRSYGDYVVVAKSQKFRDAEAAGPVDPELKRDRRHYVVDFARTLYDAEKLQADLEADFGKGMVWAGKKETATEQFGELPFMAVQRLRKMVDTDLEGELNTKSKRVLNKLLVDLYISTLHEANARHSEQKRQFVNRASRDRAAQDMMRAFATQGRADSHLVSALQFNSEIVDKMQAMRDQAKQGGDSMLKTHLRNEILQRHMMDLDFRETPIQDKLMSLNSFWMLLTSPGYYVQNAFQVMMMTQPVLAGRFGQGRSMRQLMRGYQDAMRVLKGSSWNEAADLSRFNGTADEKAMLVELQARGLLDFGISAELGYWEASGEISKVFNQTMRKVGMATRKLEVMNRMTSALAAYRMMYERSSGAQTERHAAAVEYADSIINDTHGNYGTSNAPRYLRMVPKPMTQFRKFPLFQLSLFVKVIHGSVKGASPQEKRVMLATLGYLFMNHALLAGAVGIPASALLGAIYAIAGDDDDPNDWEVDVRRAIGDKEMADLILHGLPSLININMSNKIGAGTMLDPLPFVEYEATRGGYEKAVTAAMGPLIGGLGAQVVDAFGRILKGDVAQGTAQLLPRGFRDAARGFMAAQDGIQLRNGQTALTPEELSFYDSLMMGLGLPTLKTTSRTETQFKSQQYEQFFKTRVTKIKRQYSEAYEDNDREAMLEARQAWAEMQASRKNLGFKAQPLSDLLKAPREKAKAEAKLENGIRTSEQARGFVKSLQ